MKSAREIVSFCEAKLASQAFQDSSYNGLQVEGRRPVRRVGWCVTACLASIHRAAEQDVDLLLAHHGLFWQGQSPLLVGGLGKRVSALFEQGMSLAAFHLPLDAHPQLGNNAQIAEALGLSDPVGWGEYRGNVIGVGGKLEEFGPEELRHRLEVLFGRSVLHLPGGPDRVRTVAVVSGGAASMAADAARDGFDAFVTGEPTESVTHVAVEEGIHVYACGHHDTEVFGVRALASLVGREFGLDVVDCDTPNPV